MPLWFESSILKDDRTDRKQLGYSTKQGKTRKQGKRSFVFTSLVSISLFISSIFYFFIFKEGLTQVENQNKDLLNSQEFSNISNFNENRYSSLSSSAIEMLRELKRLKDEGVISEEEYNEKRQKYIDKLWET